MMQSFGYGKNYANAHSELEEARNLTYLPEVLSGKKYYEPSDFGAERQLKETLSKLRPTKD